MGRERERDFLIRYIHATHGIVTHWCLLVYMGEAWGLLTGCAGRVPATDTQTERPGIGSGFAGSASQSVAHHQPGDCVAGPRRGAPERGVEIFGGVWGKGI